MYDDEQGATQLYNHDEALGVEWSVNVSDDDTRNLSAMEVATLYLQGQLSAEDTYVWRDGMGDWVPLGQAEELQTVIATVQGVQTGPSDAGGFDEDDFGSTQIADVPGTAESPFAGTMMLSGEEHPGDDDPFAAARPAAAESEPEDRLVGERNEASTLFSLDDLKKQADERVSRRGAKKPAEDDDPLAAIMSAPSGGGFGQAFAPPPVHAPAPPPPPPKPEPAPIPSAPPPGAYPSLAPAQAHASMAPMPMSQAPQQKSNKGLIIGAAAAIFLLVAGVGAFMAFGGGDEPTEDEMAANDAKPADEKKPEETKEDEPEDETPTATTDEGDEDDKAEDEGDDEDEEEDEKVASNSSTTSPSSVSSGADKKDPEPATKKKKKKKKKKEEAKAPGKFSPDAARSALGAAAGAASGCKKKGGPTGRGRVTVTFAPSGRATQATVGPPFAGTSVGSCAAGAFKSARVPPFTGSPVTVSKSFFIK